MHYDYVVTLKRENAHKTDLVSLLLLIFSLLAFSFVQIRNGLNLFLCLGIAVVLSGLAGQPAICGEKKGNAVQILAFRDWNMLDRHAFFTMADYTIFCHGHDGSTGEISAGDWVLF